MSTIENEVLNAGATCCTDEYGLLKSACWGAVIAAEIRGHARGYQQCLDDLTADAHRAAQGWAAAVQIEQRAKRVRESQAVNQ